MASALFACDELISITIADGPVDRWGKKMAQKIVFTYLNVSVYVYLRFCAIYLIHKYLCKYVFQHACYDLKCFFVGLVGLTQTNPKPKPTRRRNDWETTGQNAVVRFQRVHGDRTNHMYIYIILR